MVYKRIVFKYTSSVFHDSVWGVEFLARELRAEKVKLGWRQSFKSSTAKSRALRRHQDIPLTPPRSAETADLPWVQEIKYHLIMVAENDH